MDDSDLKAFTKCTKFHLLYNCLVRDKTIHISGTSLIWLAVDVLFLFSHLTSEDWVEVEVEETVSDSSPYLTSDYWSGYPLDKGFIDYIYRISTHTLTHFVLKVALE